MLASFLTSIHPSAIFHRLPGFIRFLIRGDHTETVDLEFDPSETSYEDLLTMFWNNHDSTSCHNRQYMSAIFFHGEEQKALAEKTRDEHQKTLKRKIQTVIKPAETFYDAEE